MKIVKIAKLIGIEGTKAIVSAGIDFAAVLVILKGLEGLLGKDVITIKFGKEKKEEPYYYYGLEGDKFINWICKEGEGEFTPEELLTVVTIIRRIQEKKKANN